MQKYTQMRNFILTSYAKAYIIKMKVTQMRNNKEGGLKMYPNLDREINANGMSWRSVSGAIGMPESTFRNKITSGDFSIGEAFSIKERVFPKYELEYLFEKVETKSA